MFLYYLRQCLTLQLFVRAHFSYNPDNDSLIPCHEAGLRFLAGDILQIVNQEDPHWWQVSHQRSSQAIIRLLNNRRNLIGQ